MKRKPRREESVYTQLHPGKEILLTIKRLGINGEGIGYYKRQAVFVPGALTDEVVECRIEKIVPGYAVASLMEIKEVSPNRVKPFCPVYEKCGGCQLQHLSYEGQLEAKRDLILQAIDRYTTDPEDLIIHKTLGMADPTHYRNKSALQLRDVHGRVHMGLYEQGTHKLVDMTECPVQHKLINETNKKIQSIIQKYDIPIYDERNGRGILRTVVVRAGIETGETQVVFVTTSKKFPMYQNILADIERHLPHVVSVCQNVHPEKTSAIFGDETIVLAGKKAITERLEELSFELSARAFFQLNPEQTSVLYNEVKRAAALTGKEIVIDAYCGVGTIGLWLAPHAKSVYGIEIVPEAVEDATRNAERLGYKNCMYVCGKTEEILAKREKRKQPMDVLVIDPPRTGLDERLIRSLLRVRPKRIVYVSCNPSTLAKDLRFLMKGYEVGYIQPVDMFPQTAHVEAVVQLIAKER
ncbi:MAG: 23S rRNA (uracil(1939)-C(5))-methyltransferase RlmD [Bacilli bacterium]